MNERNHDRYLKNKERWQKGSVIASICLVLSGAFAGFFYRYDALLVEGGESVHFKTRYGSTLLGVFLVLSLLALLALLITVIAYKLNERNR